MTSRIICGEALHELRLLPARSCHTAVTSPPYYGLRDYGHPEQLGCERSPALFVARLVTILRELRRVLRDDGTLWINLGDSYAGSWGAQGHDYGDLSRNAIEARQLAAAMRRRANTGSIPPGSGLKRKDLVGIPWMVAFALRADGWYLRSEVIWAKKNCMPESVSDRPTRAHETIFLLSKSPRYYYDADAIMEPQEPRERRRRLLQAARGLDSVYSLKRDGVHGQNVPGATGAARSVRARAELALRGTRNKRSVWWVSTAPLKEPHFAAFPADLIEPCILAGAPRGGGSPRPVHRVGNDGPRRSSQRPALRRHRDLAQERPHRQPEARA